MLQHPTEQPLYGHLPPITKTIQIRQTRHAGHCWRSRDELISDVLLWTPSHSRAKAERPARTYIQKLSEDTGCSPEDLPKAMNDRERCRERVINIRADGTRSEENSVSLLEFAPRNHVQVISCEDVSVCRLKYTYIYFSSSATLTHDAWASGLNSELYFSLTGCFSKLRQPCLLYYFAISRRDLEILVPRAMVQNERE